MLGRWLVSALSLSLTLALPAGEAAASPPRKSGDAPASTPEPVLERFGLDRAGKVATYTFRVGEGRRIVRYERRPDGALLMDVRAKLDRPPVLRISFEADGLRAETEAGPVPLVDGRLRFPPDIDRAALKLAAQDLIRNPSTSPANIYGLVVADLMRDGEGSRGAFRPIDGQPLEGDSGLFGNIWTWLFSSCPHPNQSASCAQVDAEGNATEVTITCECGTPRCQTITAQAEVPVIKATDDGGFEVVTVTRPVTFCVCSCLAVCPHPRNICG